MSINCEHPEKLSKNHYPRVMQFCQSSIHLTEDMNLPILDPYSSGFLILICCGSGSRQIWTGSAILSVPTRTPTEDGGVLVRGVGGVLLPAPNMDQQPLESIPVEAVALLIPNIFHKLMFPTQCLFRWDSDPKQELRLGIRILLDHISKIIR